MKNMNNDKQTSTSTPARLSLDVQGMTCGGCADHVEKALSAVPGVVKVRVPDWQSGLVHVDAGRDVSPESLVAAVQQAGYSARIVSEQAPETTGLPLPGDTDYDLVVIGTGGAGVAGAIRAAENGFRVAIVEAGTIGGTCVNIGCVPSKTLIRAAEVAHKARKNPFEGVHTSFGGVYWPAVREQKDALVGQLRQQKYIDVLQAYENITLIRGRARLDENGDVEIDGKKTLRAGKVLIATGARPKMLPIPGAEEVEFLTSTSLMDLDKLPETLLVIGGRAVALELGQTFARFGVKVAVLQRSERLIPDHEPELGEALADALSREGLAVHTGVHIEAVRQEKQSKVIVARIDGRSREFRADQILMATGNTPNTEDLGLDAAGVARDKHGFIEVDTTMRTSNAKIYAAGDVTTLPKFVYVAAACGGIAAENALSGTGREFDTSVLPAVIFTDPQVATVGMTEARARAEGYAVKTSILPLEYVPRAIAARETRGLIKLVADAASDRLLGAHVLAAEAGEMIQTAALAIKFGREHGFTVAALRDMLFPYLTQVEGIKLAAQTFDKDVATLSCCAG